MSSYWKEVEREIVDRFGGHRMGATGMDDADVHTEEFCIQVKYRKSLPKWLTGAFENASRNAKKHGLRPFTVLKEKGKRWGDAMILLPMSEFQKLLEERDEALLKLNSIDGLDLPVDIDEVL